MPLKPEALEELTALIATSVPALLFARVVKDQDLVKDFDLLVKNGPQDSTERNLHVVRQVLTIYDNAGMVDRLALKLYENMTWHATFIAAIAPYCVPPAADADARQALLSRRDNLLVSEVLHRYSVEYEPRICCIAGRMDIAGGVDFTSGTGVLVGPDLVLTSMHIFDPMVRAGKAADVPDTFAVFFDHVHGEAIQDPGRNDIPARRVKLHGQWLVASSDSLQDDGKLADPTTPPQVAVFRSHLDFALIRLAEEIGRQTVDRSGGRRRLWVDAPTPAIPASLQQDHRIIITQHPHGNPRLVDIGRFTAACTSGTRIRYTTNAAKGTSGAPCFNNDLALVGIHNAAYRPNGVPVSASNQAIRFDHILAVIGPHLQHQASNEHRSTRVWNVAPPGKIRVVLGRHALLDWIERASQDPVSARSDRLYAATGSSNAGKTFSIEILSAARRDSGEPTVVIGTSQELLPTRVEDVVRVILDQLRVPAAALASLPVRPAADLPEGSPDGDKLQKWASEAVPQWFAGVLDQHREHVLDRREAARRIVKEYQDAGATVPDDMRELANSPEPKPVKPYQWRAAWIVLDRLGETTMTAEVRYLIAGLVAASIDETAVAPALRRLRWLFLGDRPAFVKTGDVTVEALVPAEFTAQAVVDCVESVHAARNSQVPAGFFVGVKAALDAFDASPLFGPALNDPAQRLVALQDFATRVVIAQ